jgi:hypothetical protein
MTSWVVLAEERNRLRRVASALDFAGAALAEAEQVCRYHGPDFEKSGMRQGLPRCDSCKQPFRVRRALDALAGLDIRSYAPASEAATAETKCWLLVGPASKRARQWALANCVPISRATYIDAGDPTTVSRILSAEGVGMTIVYLGGAPSSHNVVPEVRQWLELLVAKGATEIMDDGSGL